MVAEMRPWLFKSAMSCFSAFVSSVTVLSPVDSVRVGVDAPVVVVHPAIWLFSTGTSLYVKEADAGLNTGWVGK